MTRYLALLTFLVFCCGTHPFSLLAPAGAQPIRTLLITGKNNHNWRYTSRVHADTLEATGRFDVTITDDPARDLASPGMLARHQLIVLDYNAEERWPEDIEKAFSDHIRRGCGLVSIHASNNAFRGWEDYERMHALMWRKGETTHGKFHEFTVEFVDRDHPIVKGIADFTTPDELYHNMVNPHGAEYTLLARAMSSTESGGSGKYEPMALTRTWGQGRVFATPLGHTWEKQDATKVSVVNPGFRALLVRGAEWAATGKVTLDPQWSDTRPHNALTPEEQAAGWTLLFDGSTTAGWHAWRQEGFPKAGWSVQGGTLCFTPGNGGGDIATDADYADFELSIEWKVGPGGNSGIMYRAAEGHDYPWRTGREFQVLDDLRHVDGKKPKTRAGCMYDLFALAHDTARPAGEWNHARIVAVGTRIEHWLNGFKVVDIDTASPAYAEAMKNSKFATMPGFGEPTTGRITLQDHGDPVWYRNIKLRRLGPGTGAAPAREASE
ncbi:MAG: family 16 glycoside hydrolase [Planctomycetota bacterium]|nr:family 16 glycoside hydrolase [Planctomycetota bacterium]